MHRRLMLNLDKLVKVFGDKVRFISSSTSKESISRCDKFSRCKQKARRRRTKSKFATRCFLPQLCILVTAGWVWSSDKAAIKIIILFPLITRRFHFVAVEKHFTAAQAVAMSINHELCRKLVNRRAFSIISVGGISARKFDARRESGDYLREFLAG